MKVAIYDNKLWCDECIYVEDLKGCNIYFNEVIREHEKKVESYTDSQ